MILELYLLSGAVRVMVEKKKAAFEMMNGGVSQEQLCLAHLSMLHSLFTV